MSMHFFRLSPFLAVILLAGLALAPRAVAVTNDELLPENLVGKTLRFTHTAATPNSLEPAINSYTITFNTSTTYTRTGAGLGTVNGTYSVLVTFVAPNTNTRLTTLGMTNWYGTGGSVLVSLNLTHAVGIGAFSANETLNPLKNSGGLLTIDGSTGGGGGGGGATAAPTIVSAPQAAGAVGTAFSYQILANNLPTSYAATGLPAGLSVNPTTGLISGTPTAGGAFTVSLSATNALGTGSAQLNLSISGSGSGGGGSGNLQLGAGLIAYYKFENSTNDSAGSNNGTPVGGLTYAASRPNFGQAASFNGANQYITIPHNAAFNIGSSGLTVSLWVNTANPKATANGSRLVEKQTAGVADGWTFDTYDLARQGRNVVRLASTTAGLNSTRTFTANTWQHRAFVYSGGTVTFYLNGIASGSGSVGTLVNNTLPIQIGGPRGAAASGEFFAGLMDEVRIYNRALTLSEIGNLSEGDQSTNGLGGSGGTFAAAPSNLVGYRNRVGQTFEFTVTGAASGAVWGTDVYTDDSTVARAAVHAGVVAVGETKNVTVTILGRRARTPPARATA